MDNYFEINEALCFSEQALRGNQTSYTYAIITALIKAQKESDHSGDQVFKTMDEVRKNNSLSIDMRTEAISIIFNYIDNYKDPQKDSDNNQGYKLIF